MSNLNSFDLLSHNKNLKKMALKYGLKGSVKFAVDVWQYDHIDNVVINYTCSYVDLNNGNPIAESITRENIESAFSGIEKFFSKVSSTVKEELV